MREVKRWRKKEGLPINGRFKNEPKWEHRKPKESKCDAHQNP